MILIIGAGLSGLESRTSNEQKEQGYGLTLRHNVLEQLAPVLDMSEAALRTAVSVDKQNGVMSTYLMHIKTGEKLGAGAFKPEFLRDFRANRKRLRLTIQGDVNVEFNHKLVGIEFGDGSVIVNFANGVWATGDLLVAADGVHSFIRTTLLPQFKPEDFNGLMYNGIRKMAIPDFEKTLRSSLGDLTVQPGIGDSIVIAVTIYDIDLDEDMVYISWGLTRRSIGLDDPLFAPYSGKRNSISQQARAQLWREIANLPHPLVEPFRTIFEDPDAISKDEILNQSLVRMLIGQEDLSNILNKYKVLFIGDSAHNWSNHAGTGGNNAIMDGFGLGKILQEGRSPEEFYENSYQRWKDGFDNNAKIFQDMIRPQEEWDQMIESQNQARL